MNLTTDKAPIKRDEFLKPLSREHHHGLLFCWKIRTGMQKKIPADRMAAYAKHFYKTGLLPHFEAEEKLIFPLLGKDHPLIVRALFEHRELKGLFTEKKMTEETFQEIIAKLNYHIRFEERILFQEIQNVLSANGMQNDALAHPEPEPDDYQDTFWERTAQA